MKFTSLSLFLMLIAGLCFGYVLKAFFPIKNSPNSIAWWWNSQSPLWQKGKTYYPQIRDRLRDDELRQKLAPMMQDLFPGESTCLHCNWPWSMTDGGHTIEFTPGCGGFALCEHCWKSLGDRGEYGFICQRYEEARKKWWSGVVSEETLREAVKKDIDSSRRQWFTVSREEVK